MSTTINRWVVLSKTRPNLFDFGIVEVLPDYGYRMDQVMLACGCSLLVRRGTGHTSTDEACDRHRTRYAL
jgi:hypothetical protein